jgi:hypothetical protein
MAPMKNSQNSFGLSPLLVIILLASCFFSSVVLAENSPDDYITPPRKATSADLSIDEEFEPIPGTYYYDVFLKGTKLGRATIEVSRQGDEYIVAVTARTRGVMKYLYKVKYRGHAVVQKDPLQPSSALIEEQTGSKKKTIHAEFPRPDKVTTIEKESKGDGPSVRKEKEFVSESFILDPFSTVFLIRSLDWEIGTDEVFDIFTGNKQYELHLFCRGETVLTVDGVSRDVWEIVPQTRSLKKPQKKKLSGFVVYLSQDERKEILKITGEPKIGKIVANLRKFAESNE